MEYWCLAQGWCTIGYLEVYTKLNNKKASGDLGKVNVSWVNVSLVSVRTRDPPASTVFLPGVSHICPFASCSTASLQAYAFTVSIPPANSQKIKGYVTHSLHIAMSVFLIYSLQQINSAQNINVNSKIKPKPLSVTFKVFQCLVPVYVSSHTVYMPNTWLYKKCWFIESRFKL